MTADELRAALARPETYPGNPSEVQVRETHISWVFLADDRAYKLKKPLVLSFLDYGTRERRREMCLEEVRLNRRLAPRIYLGVRGVAPTAAGSVELVRDDDPHACDYLVEMRRYDEAITVAATLGRGELTKANVEAVGRSLASFHGRCTALAGDRGHSAERAVDRNLRELLEVAELAAETSRVLALGRFLRAFISSHRHELDGRAARGLVRDGHGDLRAEHVLLGDPVQVVDCVEFDASLRAIDVADDLAYLVMDLAALGGERFGAVLVDAYRAAGGDCGDRSLLAFFAVHRALVRAKVLLIRARQQPPGSAAHGHASAQARELLAVAERFSWRARAPLALVLCGVPASGKSHLAAELAHNSCWATLSSDVVRKKLAGVPSPARAPVERYSAEFSRSTYSELGRRAASEVDAAGGVVIDATFRRRQDRDAFRDAFGAAAPLLFVECRAPRSVLAARALRREREPMRASDADLRVVLRESRRWEPLDEIPDPERAEIRTDRPTAEIAEDVREMLDRYLATQAADP